MRGFHIPSRNKIVTHQDYCFCPYCKTKIKYNDLKENDYDKFSENTIIIYCKNCQEGFIPNITHNINYKYTNHCKTKDKHKLN